MVLRLDWASFQSSHGHGGQQAYNYNYTVLYLWLLTLQTLCVLCSHETHHTQWEHPRTGRTKTLSRGKWTASYVHGRHIILLMFSWWLSCIGCRRVWRCILYFSHMIWWWHYYKKVSKYDYIIMHLKASWAGLICRTHQYYCCQWLPIIVIIIVLNITDFNESVAKLLHKHLTHCGWNAWLQCVGSKNAANLTTTDN